MSKKLSFWKKSTFKLAKRLLGCCLIHETKSGTLSGKIVETEAYLKDDPASHSFSGKTERNEAMFGSPGKAYIYFTYGLHYCFNVVTNKEGIGEAVLIRALKPLEGIKIMRKNRKIKEISQLCNGPAKLVQALAINKSLNCHNLSKKPLFIKISSPLPIRAIVQTTRIGISKGSKLRHRFYIKNSHFVSKK